MKKFLALMSVLMLLLCACGNEAPASEKTEDVPATQQNQTAEITAETTAEGYYIQEKTLDDGTHVMIYRDGGPEGSIVRGFCTYPDGATSEETYNLDGKLEYICWNDPDGSVFETHYYPSGITAKSISSFADGSYLEIHYLDNGYIDEATGTTYDGTIVYDKSISPDGRVDEHTYNVEADGSRWSTEEWEDGTIVESHYSANGMLLEMIQNNEETGDQVKITYYENGNEKTRDSHYAERGMDLHLEYYENGSMKYSLIDYGSSKTEEKINEAGYTVYYSESTVQMEFFADDNGELVKVIEKGTVYEGSAIPSNAIEMFKQVRKVPAQDVTTTQGEDGTTSTTTTYADGSTSTTSVGADGGAVYETVTANGDEYYEEYYPSGMLKRIVTKSGDMFQETHYDEEGYYIYYLQKVPGFELEITCDETGKVNKVLVDGVEQTDIESYVKDMFFRSW